MIPLNTFIFYPQASLAAQLVKNPPACRRQRFHSWAGKIPCRRDRLPTQYSWALLVVQLVKNPPAMRETRFNPWLGKILWRSKKLPTPIFWPGEVRWLYSPWGHKESDTTEPLSLFSYSQQHIHIFEKCFMCVLTLLLYSWLSTFWKETLHGWVPSVTLRPGTPIWAEPGLWLRLTSMCWPNQSPWSRIRTNTPGGERLFKVLGLGSNTHCKLKLLGIRNHNEAVHENEITVVFVVRKMKAKLCWAFSLCPAQF